MTSSSYDVNISTIKLLYNELIDKKIIKDIWITQQFPDDPKIHNCGAVLYNSKKFSDGKSYTAEAYGFSFDSEKKALFKCLTESIERFSQNCYRNSQLLQSSYNELKEPALDPYLYINDKEIRNKKFHWVKGKNITQNYNCLIPAQLVYLTYNRENDEVLLQDINTTGSAGGFDFESTLLRAIYEVVERDSIMNIFLGKFPAKRIDIKSIPDPKLKKLILYLKRYKMEVEVFDITTDIDIPSYLSITIDRTGIGPALGFGTKTSHQQLEAIAGSIEESLQTRPWLRTDLLKLKSQKKYINPDKISSLRERGMFWAGIHNLNNLSFLLNQNFHQLQLHNPLPTAKALKKSLAALSHSGFDVYWVDMTLHNFFSFPFYVYKAIIPGTQPLPLNEELKTINIQRLQKVAQFYKRPLGQINTLPQPML